MEILLQVIYGLQNRTYVLPFIEGWYDDKFLQQLLEFFQHDTGVHLSKLLLGVHGKLSLHHPIVILRLGFQHIRHRL